MKKKLLWAVWVPLFFFAYGYKKNRDAKSALHVWYVDAPVRGMLNRPIKVAQLSQLAIRGFGQREQMILSLLKREAPDIIVIMGGWTTTGEFAALRRAFFSQLAAPMGIYAIYSDADSILENEQENAQHQGFDGSPVIALTSTIRGLRGTPLRVVGLHPHRNAFAQGLGTSSSTCVALFSNAGAWDTMEQKCFFSFATTAYNKFFPTRHQPGLQGSLGEGLYVQGTTSSIWGRFFPEAMLSFVTLHPVPMDPKFAPTIKTRSQNTTWEVLHYKPGVSLKDQIQIKTREAFQKNQIPMLYLSAMWCGPCKVFKSQKDTISIKDALRGTHVMEIEKSEWMPDEAPFTELKFLDNIPDVVPIFVKLGTTGEPTDDTMKGMPSEPAVLAQELNAFVEKSMDASAPH